MGALHSSSSDLKKVEVRTLLGRNLFLRNLIHFFQFLVASKSLRRQYSWIRHFPLIWEQITRPLMYILNSLSPFYDILILPQAIHALPSCSRWEKSVSLLVQQIYILQWFQQWLNLYVNGFLLLELDLAHLIVLSSPYRLQALVPRHQAIIILG